MSNKTKDGEESSIQYVYTWKDVTSDPQIQSDIKKIYEHEKSVYMPWKLRELLKDFLCTRYGSNGAHLFVKRLGNDDLVGINWHLSELTTHLRNSSSKNKDHAKFCSDWLKACKANPVEAYTQMIRRVFEERECMAAYIQETAIEAKKKKQQQQKREKDAESSSSESENESKEVVKSVDIPTPLLPADATNTTPGIEAPITTQSKVNIETQEVQEPLPVTTTVTTTTSPPIPTNNVEKQKKPEETATSMEQTTPIPEPLLLPQPPASQIMEEEEEPPVLGLDLGDTSIPSNKGKSDGYEEEPVTSLPIEQDDLAQDKDKTAKLLGNNWRPRNNNFAIASTDALSYAANQRSNRAQRVSDRSEEEPNSSLQVLYTRTKPFVVGSHQYNNEDGEGDQTDGIPGFEADMLLETREDTTEKTATTGQKYQFKRPLQKQYQSPQHSPPQHDHDAPPSPPPHHDQDLDEGDGPPPQRGFNLTPYQQKRSADSGGVLESPFKKRSKAPDKTGPVEAPDEPHYNEEKTKAQPLSSIMKSNASRESNAKTTKEPKNTFEARMQQRAAGLLQGQ